ncbi:hypothetical protein TWF281_001408 [Arthrobotrys megalospora]
MDPTYPTQDEGQYGSPPPQRNRGHQEGQPQYWGPGNSQQYEDPPLAGSTAIDPQFDYVPGSPTILPPGTSIANYSGYRPYPGYGSSSSTSSHPAAQFYERQQASGNEDFDYRVYDRGGQDAADSYPQSHYPDEVQSPGHDRPRPEKKYLCTIADCPRSIAGFGFTTLNDLERHGRSKHGDDGQYIECRHERCPDRGKRFPRRDNFVDHYWRVHGDGSSKEDMKAFALEKAKEWMVVKQAGNWSQR